MLKVFITGVTSGIGEATAKMLKSHGYEIVGIGRDREKIERLKESLGHHLYSLDVSNKDDVNNFFLAHKDEIKDTSVLINNAGFALGLDKVQDGDLENYEKMIATNINGVLYVTRNMLDVFVPKDDGYIINIGSIAGSWPYVGANVYGATKAFISQYTKNLRADLHPSNIRVTNVKPGAVETNFSKVRFKGDEEKANGVYKGKHPLCANDIAEVILSLLTLNKNVNITEIEVVSTKQSQAGFLFD